MANYMIVPNDLFSSLKELISPHPIGIELDHVTVELTNCEQKGQLSFPYRTLRSNMWLHLAHFLLLKR